MTRSRTEFHGYLETTTSYVSIVELGMYEMTGKLHEQLGAIHKPGSEAFEGAFDGIQAFEQSRAAAFMSKYEPGMEGVLRSVIDAHELGEYCELVRGDIAVMLPDLIPILKKRAPGMPLVIEENLTWNLAPMLRDGELDCVLIALPFALPGIRTRVLYEEPFSVVVPAGHRWEQKKELKPTELSITALRNRVSLSGKREIQPEHERVSYHRKERAEGSFSRTVNLPSEIDAAHVEASCRDGILTLRLPKAAEAKPRQIAVRT